MVLHGYGSNGERQLLNLVSQDQIGGQNNQDLRTLLQQQQVPESTGSAQGLSLVMLTKGRRQTEWVSRLYYLGCVTGDEVMETP